MGAMRHWSIVLSPIIGPRHGSGLTVHSSSSRLVHTTVARNHGGDGSGLFITGEGDVENYSPSTAALTNVILVSHTVGITVTGGNTATVNSVLWYATPLTVSTEATATAVVQNEYSGRPGLRPRWVSPEIKLGSD